MFDNYSITALQHKCKHRCCSIYEISRGCKTQNNTVLHCDHVDNKRLSKEINPLPLYLELYIYLKKISKITQVLSDSFVGCPSSGVNKYRLTKKQRNAVLNSQQKWKFWARILKKRPNKVFFSQPCCKWYCPQAWCCLPTVVKLPPRLGNV